MRITKRFSFSAAHKLPGHEGKCANLHGHTWFLAVTIEGSVNYAGMVMDFSELKEKVGEVVSLVDHKYLNEIVPNPTAEHLILWFWYKLKEEGLGLVHLTLFESSTSWVEYCGK